MTGLNVEGVGVWRDGTGEIAWLRMMPDLDRKIEWSHQRGI